MPKKCGNQKPRIDIYENGEIEFAQKTIDLLAEYGSKLLPWQKSVLYRWMATKETGEWANHDCGLVVPRQNGKSELFIARIIGGMIFFGETLIFTAQSVKTVEEIKRRVLLFFYQGAEEIRDLLTDEFDKEPKSLDYIELRNGGRCIFRTRTRTSGLGSTNDTLLLDEAQEETDAQQEALLPTISAGKRGNSQIIRAGTPPTAGSTGEVFKRIRKSAFEDGETCWQEWSVESITATDDREAWYATNPSLGYHLQLKAIIKESKQLSEDSFNKMRLGWFAGIDSKRAFSDDDWNECIIKEIEKTDKIVYAVKFAPDRSAVSLAVGMVQNDGKIHVEIVERKPMSIGINWLSRWILERWKNACKIIIDGSAGTQLLVEELVRSDKRISKIILTPNVREAGSAYSALDFAIKNKELTHYNQPGLNLAIRTVKKRDIGRDGMFGFAPLSTEIQSDPVEAIAFAFWGARKFGEQKPRSSRNSTQQIFL